MWDFALCLFGFLVFGARVVFPLFCVFSGVSLRIVGVGLGWWW